MTGQLAHAAIVNDTGGIASGQNGMVTDVPAGFTYDTLVAGGAGVNDTMMAWGDALLARTGKTRTTADADLIVSTLGYWTDNGAYYCEKPPPPLSLFSPPLRRASLSPTPDAARSARSRRLSQRGWQDDAGHDAGRGRLLEEPRAAAASRHV